MAEALRLRGHDPVLWYTTDFPTRTSETIEYGGGGHVAVGTCQIANDKADETAKVLIERINADG